MSRTRIIAWIVFYIGIIIGILVTYCYLQERFSHNYPRMESHTHFSDHAVCARSTIALFADAGAPGASHG